MTGPPTDFKIQVLPFLAGFSASLLKKANLTAKLAKVARKIK
jgi:hypothetical protein